MKVKLKKWGNSAAVRIPASIMNVAHLAVDQTVDLRLEDGRIIIEPVTEEDELPDLDLDALLARITEDNRHEEIDWGPPVGKEVW